MTKRLVTISYTGLHAGGGVPKFNRDLHSAFPDRECLHFCWTDFPWYREVDARGETEWGRARMLNQHLTRTSLIRLDDVVVADGFWADGLERLPLAVSHSHGIWSHLTYEDVLAGKAPDMPLHHAAQVDFRRRWTRMGKGLTAVSSFISRQMWLQWGFMTDRVINNGVDTERFAPKQWTCSLIQRPLVIHGVNDRTNLNKGWDHVQVLIEELPKRFEGAQVLSLDEAFEDRFRYFSDRPWTKPEVLAQADVVVHPSGYEGNSMFVAEALSSGVPVVGYDVGFLWQNAGEGSPLSFGYVMDRRDRSPLTTLSAVKCVLRNDWNREAAGIRARKIAVELLSIERFRNNWRSYIEGIENAA